MWFASCSGVLSCSLNPRSARHRLGADGYAYFMGLLNYMMCCTNANPMSFDKFDLEAAQERHDIFEKIIIKHDLYAVLEKGRVWTLLVCVNLILTLVLVLAGFWLAFGNLRQNDRKRQ